jgi:hypothetical protein
MLCLLFLSHLLIQLVHDGLAQIVEHTFQLRHRALVRKVLLRSDLHDHRGQWTHRLMLADLSLHNLKLVLQPLGLDQRTATQTLNQRQTLIYRSQSVLVPSSALLRCLAVLITRRCFLIHLLPVFIDVRLHLLQTSIRLVAVRVQDVGNEVVGVGQLYLSIIDFPFKTSLVTQVAVGVTRIVCVQLVDFLT